MNRKNPIAGFLALLALSAIGCGGGSSRNSAPPMTQTQAADAFTAVYTAMADAAAAGALDLARSAPISPIRNEAAAPIQEAILNGARTPVSAHFISPVPAVSPDTTATIPAYTYKCPSGGTIVVTGSYSETSTSESANIVDTINSCDNSGVTFNGDPNIAFSVT